MWMTSPLCISQTFQQNRILWKKRFQGKFNTPSYKWNRKLTGRELIYRYIFPSFNEGQWKNEWNGWSGRVGLCEDLLPCFREVKFLSTFYFHCTVPSKDLEVRTYIHTLKADISLGKPWIIKTISLQEKKKTHYQQQSLRSKYDDAHFCNMYILLNIYYIFEMKYEPWPPLTCSPSSSSTFSFIMLHNSSVRIYCVANIRSSFILRICAI